MKKNGFTLLETIIALFILGIVTITVLPILEASYYRSYRNNIKIEMINLGEMAIEKLKAFNRSSNRDLYIYDLKVEDIIDEFSNSSNISLTLPRESKTKDYIIEIEKNDKNINLWKVSVKVSYIKGEKYEDIIYTSLIPKK